MSYKLYIKALYACSMRHFEALMGRDDEEEEQ
jgi:hypothetical protein